MAKDPEETRSPEVKDQEFIDEFKRMGNIHALHGYEAKNRDRLGDSSIVVLSAFDEVWKKITGKRYIQPITTVSVGPPTDGFNDVRRSDPKSMNYRETVKFVNLEWVRSQRKQGRRDDRYMVNYFTIKGIPKHGLPRVIYNNLAESQLYVILLDDIAKKIITGAKKDPTGTIDVPDGIDLKVEGYWEVQFAPMRDQYDTKDVRLCVDGYLLRMQRMIPVIVNGFHLEDADNAMREIVKHNEEAGSGRVPQPRRTVGKVQKYPYTVLRQSNYEEFIAQLERGNKQQREYEEKSTQEA